MTNSTLSVSLNDTAQLIDGFFNQTNISRFVKSYDTCKHNNLEVGNHLVELVFNIKDFSKFPDVATGLVAIFNSFGEIFQDFYKTYNGCQNITSEAPILFNAIKNYMSQENYFRSFYNNIGKSTFFFLQQWAKTGQFFTEKKYFESGKAFGELFMVIFFPEIEPVKNVLLAMETTDNASFIKCLTTVVIDVPADLNKGFIAVLEHAKDGLTKCLMNI